MEISKYIDHTILKPEATIEDIKKLCEEAKEYSFASVCINPIFVKAAAYELKNSNVKVCTVVGFPLGATPTEVKAFEATKAVEEGAEEIDMVIAVGKLKSGDVDYVEKDIKAVVEATKKANQNAIVKVIIECCLLSEEEKNKVCHAVRNAKAEFIKTSTGFSSGGATVSDVALMKKAIGDTTKIKAAGGIRDFKTAKAMIDAGADRIGASAGISIVKDSKI